MEISFSLEKQVLFWFVGIVCKIIHKIKYNNIIDIIK